MITILILFILSIIILFVGYQALRHQRTFWFAPTITGFRNRKKIDNKYLHFIDTFIEKGHEASKNILDPLKYVPKKKEVNLFSY